MSVRWQTKSSKDDALNSSNINSMICIRGKTLPSTPFERRNEGNNNSSIISINKRSRNWRRLQISKPISCKYRRELMVATKAERTRLLSTQTRAWLKVKITQTQFSTHWTNLKLNKDTPQPLLPVINPLTTLSQLSDAISRMRHNFTSECSNYNETKVDKLPLDRITKSPNSH